MRQILEKTQSPGIYRRNSSYVVVLRDGDGRQFKRCATTLKEARDIKATLLADRARGVMPSMRRMTLAEYADEWEQTFRGSLTQLQRDCTGRST